METQIDLKVKSDGLELLTGEQALRLLDNNEFSEQWNHLYQLCPWKTLFQAKSFVLTWYKVFEQEYTPLVVKTSTDGKLTGLFTLAHSVKTRIITGAGAEQAEYHAWLSTGTDNDEFVQAAVQAIQKQYPGYNILLRYIPPRTPVKWIITKRWKNKAVLRPMRQPLMRIDADLFAKRLNAKTIREKTKRLQRLGELKLERISSYSAFRQILDELITQYEFRKGATYNIAPFTSEPNKKTLLLELFKQDLLHVTVLKLNGQIIASTVNSYDKNWVCLKGLNAHVPFYSKQSPGLLQLLMLGKLLAEEGAEIFDLTPGDDVYKDKLATHFEEAGKLWIVNSRVAHLKLSLAERLKNGLVNGLKQKGVDPKAIITAALKAKDNFLFIKQRGLGNGIKKAMVRFLRKKKNRAYVIKPVTPPGILQLRKNYLADMLQFDPMGSRITRWEFLGDAMKRYEYGEHSFTITENGRLMACAWLRGKYSETLQHMKTAAPPEGAAVIHSVYCHEAFQSRLHLFLNAVAEKVSQGLDKPEIYLIAEFSGASALLSDAGSSTTTNDSVGKISIDKDSYFQ